MQKQQDKPPMQVQEYNKFFKQVNTAKLQQIELQEFQKHHIEKLSKDQLKHNAKNNSIIIIKQIREEGLIVKYQVMLSKFRIQITLINFDQFAPLYKQSLIIGSGKYGYIRLSKFKKQFVIKRQYFKKSSQQTKIQKQWNMSANKQQIDRVIIEYSFHKICSLYKIGPSIDTGTKFDLICFKDSIQFHLQFCDWIYKSATFKSYFDYKKFVIDMKENLKFMHELNLIHKDIKVDNMVYSKQYNRYVLIDFGISHPVKQVVGQKTETYCAGTLLNMSDQMAWLRGKKKMGKVDLYKNDKHGLEKQFKFILTNLLRTYLYFCKKKVQFDAYQPYQELLKIYENIENKQLNNIQEKNINYWFDKELINFQELLNIKYQEIFERKEQINRQNSLKNQIKQFQNKQYINLSQLILRQQKQIGNQQKLRNFIRIYGYNKKLLQIFQPLFNANKSKYQELAHHIQINNKNSIQIQETNIENFFNQSKVQREQDIIKRIQKFSNMNENFKQQLDKIKKQIINKNEKIQLLNILFEKLISLEQYNQSLQIGEMMEKIYEQQYKNQKVQQIMKKIGIEAAKFYKKMSNVHNKIKNREQQLKTKLYSVDLYEMYDQKDPNLSELYHQLYYFYYNMNNFQKAIEFFNKAQKETL